MDTLFASLSTPPVLKAIAGSLGFVSFLLWFTRKYQYLFMLNLAGIGLYTVLQSYTLYRIAVATNTMPLLGVVFAGMCTALFVYYAYITYVIKYPADNVYLIPERRVFLHVWYVRMLLMLWPALLYALMFLDAFVPK